MLEILAIQKAYLVLTVMLDTQMKGKPFKMFRIISTMLVLTGPQICEKKIKCIKLRAMTDDNASVNNDDDGRQSQHLWVR
jgi:hypothetical protein